MHIGERCATAAPLQLNVDTDLVDAVRQTADARACPEILLIIDALMCAYQQSKGDTPMSYAVKRVDHICITTGTDPILTVNMKRQRRRPRPAHPLTLYIDVERYRVLLWRFTILCHATATVAACPLLYMLRQ